MRKNNKVSDLFGVICVFAIFAGCVERFDGGISAWTIACLAVALATGLLSKATDEGRKETTNNKNDNNNE
jgi:hypothetical protein